MKIIKRFKISDKIVWQFRVDVLAEMGEWATMKRYATEKKPLIGFKPFAVACIKHNQPIAEIEYYIDRIDSKEEKFDLYIDLEIWGKAVDAAYKLKDPIRLQEVGRLCKDATLQVFVQTLTYFTYFVKFLVFLFPNYLPYWVAPLLRNIS